MQQTLLVGGTSNAVSGGGVQQMLFVGGTVRPGWKKLTVWANLTIMTYCFTITNFEDNCQGFAMQQSLSQSNKPFSFYSHRRRALFQDFIYYFTSTKRQSNFNYPRIAIIGGWSKALSALLAPQKVWHLPKFWDDRG